MNTELSNTETQQLSHIPDTGYKATEVQTNKERRMVEFNTEARFELSTFSILQLLQGYNAYSRANKLTSTVQHHANVLAKLAAYAIAPLEGGRPDTATTSTLHLTYEEVVPLRRWIETRMAHCEVELNNEKAALEALVANAKDYGAITSEEVEEFIKNYSSYEAVKNYVAVRGKHNPATYVAQKNLLLEIRLFLAGEIVD